MSSRNPARTRLHPHDRNRSHLSAPPARPAFRRPWKRSLLLFFLLAGISSVIVIYQKNVYRSEASVFVKLGRESVALDPTVTTTSTIALNETREGEINSIVEVFRSRAIAEQIVDEFGAETIYSGVLPDAETEDDSWIEQTLAPWMDSARRFNDGREVSLRERATRRLTKNLHVHVPKKSTILLLQFDTKSPDLARKVLARILEIVQEQHSRINRVTGTYDFLLSQNSVLERRLQAAREALRSEKNRLKLVSIEGARQKLQDEYALLSKQLIETNTELVAVTAKLDSLAHEMAELPDRLPSENVTGLPNEATDKMRESLYQLEIRERDLLAKFTEDHPQVKQIKNLVAEAKSVYQEQGQQRETTKTAIHPSKQKLELLYLTDKSVAVALSSKTEQLQRQIASVEHDMVALTEGEIQIANLQREVEMAEGNLRNYNERLEQARLDQELVSEKISNLNIVQPASYMEKPIGLPRLAMLAVCFCLAFLGSAGVYMIPELRQWFSPPVELVESPQFSSFRDELVARESREARNNSSHPYENQALEPVAEEAPS